MRALDLTGQTYGRLTVLAQLPNRGRERCWRVRCACGTVTEAATSNLRNGHTVSCGCHRAETLAARATTHGLTRGGVKPPEYVVWHRMRARCTNPRNRDFPLYGGRGIRVCDRWASFASFLADMGPRPSPDHTIDRVDNDGDYAPGNCRWATDTTQARNRRSNRMLTIGGETLCVAAWAERAGIDPRVLSKRLRRGWVPEHAVRSPVGTSRPTRC